jgi:hypothetical protein
MVERLSCVVGRLGYRGNIRLLLLAVQGLRGGAVIATRVEQLCTVCRP